MLQIHVVRLPHGEDLPLPSYQSGQAAGLDLLAAVDPGEALELAPGGRALVPSGIAVEIPSGYEGQVRPRSGLAHRHGITVLNAPGTIDADYRGEVKVLLINLGDDVFLIRRGDRIAQLVICPVTRVQLIEREALVMTARNEKGFGSTGTA